MRDGGREREGEEGRGRERERGERKQEREVSKSGIYYFSLFHLILRSPIRLTMCGRWREREEKDEGRGRERERERGFEKCKKESPP